MALCVRTHGKKKADLSIVEIAAVVAEGDTVTETFHRIPAPQGGVTPALMRLTGLSREELDNQPSIEEVMAEFLDVLPDGALCVAHGTKGLRALLRRLSSNLFRNRILDTLTFAGVCLPTSRGYSLAHLADTLALERNAATGALGDAFLVKELWRALTTVAENLPLPVLVQASGLLTPLRSDPLQRFFRDLTREKHHSCPEERGRSFSALFPTASFPKRRKPKELDFESIPIEPEKVATVFAREGLLAMHLSAFEYRAEQREMALAVTEALNTSRHVMVEAGTGIGKSLAYLVPSILWSLRNDTPFIVSTNTKNLQAQLFDKDLPLLREALGETFEAALIKGRRNYLCLRKLLYLLDNADLELERDERLPMASIVCWAYGTESGDVSESVVASRPHLRQLASRLTSIAEECPGPGCVHHKKCFLQRARRKALSADIVVANHSVVFSEMAMPLESPVLPPYQHIVFDEAHNLEDAITNAMSAEVSQRRILFVLNRLWRTGRRKRKRGLLATMAYLLSELDPDTGEARELALSFAAAAGESVDHARDTVDPFLNALAALLPPGRDRQSRRFRPERRLPEKWEPIMAAKRDVIAALAEVGESVGGLIETLGELSIPLPKQEELARELKACVLWNGEATHDMEMVLAAENRDYVYWVERVPEAQGNARAWGAPTNVGPLMFEHLYSAKRSVVFTSATLTVQGSSQFVEKRLGVHLVEPERMMRLIIGTPFDYARQCLVLVPTFLPDPGRKDGHYAAELGQLIADIVERTDGRAMGLFTSYEMLRDATNALFAGAHGQDRTILAQGLSGSRENITARFKQDVRSVLMGTHSFWEGVDIAGESLSCLILARLPFAVFTDPIIEARCERVEEEGENAFMGYSLPSAVIRFRQGFGRLIRHRNDRGVVIVADRRIVTKRYGQWFQSDLPTPLQIVPDPEELLDLIEEFLAPPTSADGSDRSVGSNGALQPDQCFSRPINLPTGQRPTLNLDLGHLASPQARHIFRIPAREGGPPTRP